MSAYTDMLVRFEARHGDKFDSSDLDPRFKQFYGTGARIGVRWDDDSERIEYGTVSVTTGWRPCFLLMHRSSDHGSGTLLDKHHWTIVKVKYAGARSYRDFLPDDDISAKSYT